MVGTLFSRGGMEQGSVVALSIFYFEVIHEFIIFTLEALFKIPNIIFKFFFFSIYSP